MMNRRRFLQTSAAAVGALSGLPSLDAAQAEAPKGDRPSQAAGVAVLNPRTRVPLSFLIDDSTPLVNLAHFCIPQFQHAFPGKYPQDWRKLPREIPDAFVRKFGEWCRERKVRGKYSVIPYPACVGWIDRELPGWTRKELDDSLALLRDFMAKDWDFTPEMVTHTRMVDIKTGKPVPEYNAGWMENTWSAGKSYEQLHEYCAYALQGVKDAGLVCQGVTSPGGFAGRSLPNYSKAVFQACCDVYGTEIPFYLKKVHTDDRSVAPEVLCASGLDTDDPKAVVSIIGCTGDWFGGWDGLTRGSVDQFITEDLKGGRLPQVIAKGEPAVLLCHWPGMYFNGEEVGFNILKEIVARLDRAYDHLAWMTFSELARYWSAKELTRIDKAAGAVTFKAPFACPQYTVRVDGPLGKPPSFQGAPLREVARPLLIGSGAYVRDGDAFIACFDLPKGPSTLTC
ncbi:MAG TPA: twin-arginine translocation signal domain-containing protein [Planctomycetota bacterium]|nr:twin-arginine translocation signal domain-containing protein [Planctomycetota bacterium]